MCIVGKTAEGVSLDVVVPVPAKDHTGKSVQTTVCATSTSATHDSSVRAQTSKSYSTQAIDEHYLRGPTCVVCGSPRRQHISRKIAGAWLHWQDNRGGPVSLARTVQDGDIPLGTYGNYSFFVASGQAQRFVDFSIAVLSATTLVSGGTAGSAGTNVTSAKSLTLTNPLTGENFIVQ
jgi:hypothetical protein